MVSSAHILLTRNEDGTLIWNSRRWDYNLREGLYVRRMPMSMLFEMTRGSPIVFAEASSPAVQYRITNRNGSLTIEARINDISGARFCCYHILGINAHGVDAHFGQFGLHLFGGVWTFCSEVTSADRKAELDIALLEIITLAPDISIPYNDSQIAASKKGKWSSMRIEELLIEPIFTDVKLISRGREFKAHKAILGIRSETFRQMLTKPVDHLNLDDIDPDLLEDVLKFIYGAETSIEAFWRRYLWGETRNSSLNKEVRERAKDLQVVSNKQKLTGLQDIVERTLNMTSEVTVPDHSLQDLMIYDDFDRVEFVNDPESSGAHVFGLRTYEGIVWRSTIAKVADDDLPRAVPRYWNTFEILLNHEHFFDAEYLVSFKLDIRLPDGFFPDGWYPGDWFRDDWLPDNMEKQFCSSARPGKWSTIGIIPHGRNNYGICVPHFRIQDGSCLEACRKQRARVTNDIASLLADPIHYDAILVSQGQEFKVHKVILGAASAALRDVLSLDDEPISRLELDAKPETVEMLLEYVYKGRGRLVDRVSRCLSHELELDVVRGSVVDLLTVANRYMFDEVEMVGQNALVVLDNAMGDRPAISGRSIFNLKHLAGLVAVSNGAAHTRMRALKILLERDPIYCGTQVRLSYEHFYPRDL